MQVLYRIRKARKKLGESQTEFAKRFGVHQTTLSYWETGRNIPKGPARIVVEQELAKLEMLEDAE